MTMITPSYLGETIEYSSLHACRSTLEDPTGRFAKIGIPAPQLTGPFVGLVEIICVAMLIVGFATVLATIPLLIDIAVAIATTKLSVLGRQGFWPTMQDLCRIIS